uniref:Glycerophosphocholine phosphodiesterase GPCPD1 n=1 Tax=Plectus sambesii TaxID=2011161 RepID=A0A914WIA2_9BILA
MAAKTSIDFCVCVQTRSWESVYVVGNTVELGSWEAVNALPLMRRADDPDIWVGHADVTLNSELRYRYFTCHFLDPCKDSAVNTKEMIITRWEAIRQPRSILPHIESRQGVYSRKTPDTFGSYAGRTLINDGWLMSALQVEIRLKLHGEALKFYKARHQQRVYKIKVTPFDLRIKEFGSIDAHDDDGDNEDTCDATVPLLPSYSSTELSVMSSSNPRFFDQKHTGHVFTNNSDYFVFRTQSVAVEFLAFRFELFLESSGQPQINGHTNGNAANGSDSSGASGSAIANGSHGSNGSHSSNGSNGSHSSNAGERVAIGYLLPSSMNDTFGKSIAPLFSKSQLPIGQITVDYLFIKPLLVEAPKHSMRVSYHKHWKKRGTIEIGHRGMGNSYSKFAAVRENTIHSLNSAARNGADFVEFDVQLTKDKIPVIFHDFHVSVSVAKRSTSYLNLSQPDWKGAAENVSNPIEQHVLAVKDLKLYQLHLLHLSHLKEKEKDSPPVLGVESKTSEVTGEDDETLEHRPFPTLKQALTQVDPNVGFNVEIKYPMLQKDGTWECEHYWERNEYIDIILAEVLNYAADRRIVFSSFDPDICTLVHLKQNIYPVLFLCLGATTRYIPFLDQRSNTPATAVLFAASSSILGVNFNSEDLLRDANPVKTANTFGLVSFVWGDDLDNKANIEYFKKELGVDGIIYDRIGEECARQNVFTVEREAKNALFKLRSRSPSVGSSHGSAADVAGALNVQSLVFPDFGGNNHP